ncbi:MAG: hypothetical protein WCG25_04015 [bacterium]
MVTASLPLLATSIFSLLIHIFVKYNFARSTDSLSSSATSTL